MNQRRTLLVAVLSIAAVASAQEARPRVMVILDSSRSMLEPTNTDWPLTQMNNSGGDWDPTSPGTPCNNKFCTAKRVADSVIPDFTGEARIGLTTYYQFILRADRPSTVETTCFYDIFSPPNRVRRFSSAVDLTGSGQTVCSPATCDGSGNCALSACASGVGNPRHVNFPDSVGQGTGASLDSTCAFPSAYARPLLPNGPGSVPDCSGDRCYTLTKIGATPGDAGTTCTVYTAPSMAAPRSITVATAATLGCVPANYTEVLPGSMPLTNIQLNVPLGNTTCITGSQMPQAPVANPMGPPSIAGLTANPTLGTTAGSYNGNASGLRCTSEAPCDLYLASSAPTAVMSTRRHWFAMFDDTWVLLPDAGSPNADPPPPSLDTYTVSQSIGGMAYVPDFFRSNVGSGSRPFRNNLTTTCAPTGRYSTGNLEQFGVANAIGQLAASSTLDAGVGSANESPGRSGSPVNTLNCTGPFPCDVTLRNQVDVDTPVAGPTIYDTSKLPTSPPHWFVSDAGSLVNYTGRLASPSLTSCPGSFTWSSSATVNPAAGFLWKTGETPPGNCSAWGPCQFDFVGSLPVSAPTGTCNDVVRFSAYSSLPTCSFNGKTYNAIDAGSPPSTVSDGPDMANPWRVVARIPEAASCAPGTFSRNSIANGQVVTGAAGETTINCATGVFGPGCTNVPGGQVSATYPITLTYVSAPLVGGAASGTSVNHLAPPTSFTGSPSSVDDHPSFGPRNLGNPAPNTQPEFVPLTVADSVFTAAGASITGTTCTPGETVLSNNGTLCAGVGTVGSPARCSLRTVGWSMTGTGCGSEGGPCRRCMYQPLLATWTSGWKDCTYTAKRYNYTVDGSATECTYSRREWATRYNVRTYNCEWEIGARRYDFNRPQRQYCEYFAVPSVVRATLPTYNYEYLTKGTELIGRGSKPAGAGNLCSSTWTSANAFGVACPETIAGCAGVSPGTTVANLTTLLSQSTCRLTYGGSRFSLSYTKPSEAGFHHGRTQAYTTGADFAAIDQSHRACELGTNGPGTAVALQNASATWSQVGLGVNQSIDGNMSNSNGWALDNQYGSGPSGTVVQTAAFETVSPTPTTYTGGTRLRLEVHQVSQWCQHNLGRFRFSVTTSPQTSFASAGTCSTGACSDANVSGTASWTTLVPSAISSAGSTMTPQPDNSVLVTGAVPCTDVYTLTFETPLMGITGWRIELMKDTSIGGANGPGRTGHGNFVVTEFRMFVSDRGSPPPVSPDTYRARNDTIQTRGFCSASGDMSVSVRRLISDYFDPNPATNANNLSIYTAPAQFPAPWVVSWNNSERKTQGFSAASDAGVEAVTGALPSRTTFVPIPDDSVYSIETQRLALRSALRKCVLPSEVDLGPDGGLAGGVCVADERVRNSSGAQVVGETPLYGSLYSTYQYLLKKWETDGVDEKQCRPYNIVLLTDGIEQTPAGFTVGGASVASSVQGLVGSFRNLSPGPKTRPDVKTYIIALGTGAAGNSQLTDVAQAGGTERAFDATDYNQLLTALQGIFTSMTAGRLSRSRPAIGTDGTRIYTTEFLKPSGSGDGGSSALDWSGYLSSFIISPLGDAPTLAWEHSAKLNNAAHPARTVVAALCNNPGAVRCSNADRVVVPFATSSPLLMNQLDDSPDFAAGADAGQVVTFLLNPGAPSGSGAPFLGSTALRTSRLGPISHSAPVVVGRSPYDREYGGSTEAQRSQYAAFQATTNGDGGRPTVVLVEGNDGMLHAVRERTGDPACSTSETGVGCPNGHEAWSLVPGSMKSKMLGVGQPNLVTQLFRLMQGGWSANYLNNTVSVADVCATGSGSANDCVASDWRTIAIVTMREGGRGMSAYDITSGAAPNTARFLWDYAEDDLGLTYSIPAIGRVSDGAEERFVAVFGGGVDDPATADVEGRRVYVLNAVNGQLIREYDNFLRGSTSVSLSEGVVARPSLHRRPGANFSFASSGFVAAGPSVLAMRFAKANGTLTTDSNQWLPQELFDPTSDRSARPATDATLARTRVRRVELVDAGNPDAGVAPSYQLVVDSSLPLPSAPPILARPRLAPVLVPSGDTIDLFVGTGDVRTPIDPASEFRNGNYFYAIHDFNLQDTSATENDGRAMWVVKFPKLGTAPAPERFEQVVSEPGIISGCVIVATYTTPTVATTCSGGGDARLYGFRPRDGELQPCLVYGAGPLAGQTTPVLDMPGSGIPSDLVCVGNSCYLKTERETTSGGGNLRQIGVRVPPKPGSVRSYRRIK